jgi:hypothetical protein
MKLYGNGALSLVSNIAASLKRDVEQSATFGFLDEVFIKINWQLH